jgi:regulator of protease activity HflC (stomatin/prohibitin superfamily)
MKFRATLIAIFAVFIMLTTSGCNTLVAPGNVGLVFSKSGGGRGIQDIAVRSGRVYYNPFTTEIIEYPTYVQTVKWTKNADEGKPVDESITFTTSDSAVVNCDVASSIQLNYDAAPSFYVKFRADDVNAFVDGFYRNVVRNELNDIGGKYTVEQIMGNNGPMIADVEGAVAKQMNPIGVAVTNLGFIGACRPPSVVTDSINSKLAQQQRSLQTTQEIAQTEAQAKKNVAQAQGEADANLIRAQADAKANQLRQASLTPLLIQQEWIQKWDGQQPNVQAGAGTGLMLNIAK